uniref:VWFA domain-containing protein n=1 Tax=Plectus sambesii TaxID=2011161 RepID=A0A914X3N4_9BILA
MTSKSDETFRKVSYAVLVLGIVLGVAGLVMLIIGVSKNSSSSGSSGTCSPTGDHLNPFFVDASSSNVTWDPTMNDTSSSAFVSAKNTLVTQITNAFSGAASDTGIPSHARISAAASTNRLIKVTINRIMPGTGTGVNYYATLIFVGDGSSNDQTASGVQSSLNNAGIPSSASGDPTDQCAGLHVPPTLPPSTQTPLGTSPTSSPATQQSTTTPSATTTGCLTQQPSSPPTTMTPTPFTNPPTVSIPSQPTKAPAAAWPDITILLDTSYNLAPGSNALNNRGFEAVRMFLVNTLQQYRIDVNHTRVSLVTFDGTANVVFTFNQYLDMASLMNAIGNTWQYGPPGNHTADRNLSAALQMVLTNVYNEPSGSGYDPNHINFLWAFVTGTPTDGKGYAQTLYQLQSMGIRTQAIGLGTLDQVFLSNFGFDSFDYASPFDPVSGIASQTSPLPRMLYQESTIYSTPPPTLAQVSADIVIVIEESTQLTPGNFINVKGFLTQFFTHLQFGPAGSSVALFSYNNRSLL